MTKPFFSTPSPAAQKLEALRELFPQAVEVDDQGRIRVNPAAIQMALDPANPAGVRVEEDGYELRWVGKREAYHQAFVPTHKIVSAAHSQSKDWDTTGNLLIKGDNLDALKLLRQSYFGQVKLIYIDPPYNTQSDQFIYRDDFSVKQTEVLTSLGYSAENIDYIQNIYGARTHSGWLSFMYPRLLLARDLLREDGVIFISIDDNEQAQLKLLCDEVFGADNFISELVWEKGRKNDAKFFSNGHEYLLAYAKSISHLRDEDVLWREEKPGAREIWELYIGLRAKHGLDDSAIEVALQNWFSSISKQHPSKKWSRYKRVDKNGPWRDRDISWPGGGGPRYNVMHPKTRKPCKVPDAGWRYSDPAEMQRQIDLGLVEFRADHTEPPFRKAHIKPVAQESAVFSEAIDVEDEEGEELATQVRGSYFYKQSQVAVRHLRELLGKNVFNNPKDMEEISKLIGYATANQADALILDFFAGSGTTAEAVMRLNAEDGGKRQFILVQIPQPIDPVKQKEAHTFITQTLGRPEATIFEITAERIRRAGAKLQAEQAAKRQAQGELLADDTPPLDTGFRVFELVDDPLGLVHGQALKDANQDQVRQLQQRIATPQMDDLERVLSNLLLAEGLPLTTRIHTLVPEHLFVAHNVALLVQALPLDDLLAHLQTLKTAETPLLYLSVYAPWVQDDNLLLGLDALMDKLGLAKDKLRLRG